MHSASSVQISPLLLLLLPSPLPRCRRRRYLAVQILQAGRPGPAAGSRSPAHGQTGLQAGPSRIADRSCCRRTDVHLLNLFYTTFACHN